MQAENPWWSAPHEVAPQVKELQPRAYFSLFSKLVEQTDARRAVVLMGPRRVGKTVLVHHVIQHLIRSGIKPQRIVYLSVDHPLYNGLSLEELKEYALEASGESAGGGPFFIFFDEIQYLREWEIHLKTMVDSHPELKLTASGSAAAALRLKSKESGAGRFTDFLLPPLTFHEYMHLLQKPVEVEESDSTDPTKMHLLSPDIETLNREFVRYLSLGGYPEALFSPIIQADPARFIKSDIVDKVLLRDLPSLYGIQDIQELNSLFTTLAFNTAQEVSLEWLSRGSGVAKNTLKKYIEYLEAAFLIKCVHRVDRNARRFQRANFFKAYLTNPSIWSALFAPVREDDRVIESLTETAVFAQWFHYPQPLYYARWDKGEVDIVGLDHRQKAIWAVEVKWSDRPASRPDELKNLILFAQMNGLPSVTVTTKTVEATSRVHNVELRFVPASLYCYVVGRNIVEFKSWTSGSQVTQLRS